MADKTDEAKFERNHATFEDDPVQFCKNIYAEASDYYDDLRERNVENRMFYEGHDKVLDDRADNPFVEQSHIFVPLLKPAIDTRKSEVITKVDEKRNPLVVRPKNQHATDADREKAIWIENKLFSQLVESGYLPDVFDEQITGAEIYSTPSAVKVGWEETEEEEAVLQHPNPFMLQMTSMLGMEPPKPKVKFVKKFNGGKPYVEWIYPEEFLFQPGVSDFKKSKYVIHRMWLEFHELLARVRELGWDEKMVLKYKEEVACEDATEDGFEGSQRDDEAAARDSEHIDGYLDGKFLLCEFYIATYNESGGEVINQVAMVGNKYSIHNEVSNFKGIRFPFYVAIANKLPGTLEQMSSVDVGRPLQRLFSEAFNHYMDSASYGAFRAMKAPAEFEFTKRPKLRPGAIVYCTDPDQLTPLDPNPQPLSDLPRIAEAIAAKLRDVLNTPDTSQGIQTGEYEKATKTNLRAAGAMKRAAPTHKKYGRVLVDVCHAFLALNQQNAEDPERFVIDGGVTIDVPSLTNITDPEADKQEALLLLAEALQNPLYQNPMGMRKLRNLVEDVFRTFKKQDIDRYLPTEEELEAQIGLEAQIQDTQMKKESVMEQMALTQQVGAPTQGAS